MKNAIEEHEPTTHRFTRKEYYAMGDIGLFAEKRVELIDGEVVEMSPQKSPHAGTAGKLTALFSKLAPPEMVVRCHLPLDLGIRSEPEPDVSISRGSWSDFMKHHPKTAELTVEISNSSATFDRVRKGSLYAKAGIPEFWLVNLLDRCLEVYRSPVKSKGSPSAISMQSARLSGLAIR